MELDNLTNFSKINKKDILRLNENLLILSFIVCSYQKLLGTDYGDDIVVSMMTISVLVSVIRSKSAQVSVFIPLLFVLILVPFGILSNGMNSVFVFAKIVVFLIYPMQFSTVSSKKDKMLKYICIASIPNIICGLYQYYRTYIQGVYLIGKYEPGRGFRICGYVGHPIHYSLLLLGLLIIILYYSKGLSRIVYTGIIIFLIIHTWASFTLVMAVFVVVFKVIVDTRASVWISRFIKNHIKGVLILIGIVCTIALYFYMKLESDQIRYISAEATINNMNIITAILGRGVGSFTRDGYAESYLFKVLYETGLFGECIMLWTGFQVEKIHIGDKKYMPCIALLSLLLNMVINDGYMIPFLPMVSIMCLKVNDN